MRGIGMGLRRPGVRLAGGGGWVEGVSGLSFTTTSTNAAWTPTTVTKTGGTLTWRVYSAAGALLLESVANKPTFDLSALAGTKTIHVTSPDGWGGLTALNFTGTGSGGTADIASVNLTVATGLTSLSLFDLQGLTWTVGAAAPIPASLTYMYLYNLPGITWTVGAAAPMPTGLTFLALNFFPAGITWTVGAAAPMPTGLTTLLLSWVPGITWTVGAAAPMPTGMQTLTLLGPLDNLAPITTWAVNTLQTVTYENNLTQAQVDAVLAAIYANRASYTYATPTLDIAGTGNAAPSGVYADEDPPTTGKGMIYELVVDPETEGFRKWTVTYTA